MNKTTDFADSINPQVALLRYLEEDKFQDFRQYILAKYVGGNIDINYLHEEHQKSLLELACSCKNKVKFVELLLQLGAEVNQINKFTGKAPIHLAILHSDYETVELLVNYEFTDINQPDTFGNTAFSLASTLGKEDIVKLIQQNPAFEANENQDSFVTIISIEMRDEENRLMGQVPDSPGASSSITLNSDNLRKDNKLSRESSLMALLHSKNYDAFAIEADENNIRHNKRARHGTFLQYACKCGLTQIVRFLLDLKVNPNETSLQSRIPPIMIAAYNGHYDIIRILADTQKITYSLVDGDNILHMMFIGAMMRDNKQGEVESTSTTFGNKHQDFYKCLEYLLNNVPNSQLDVNQINQRGKTVLHYAVLADNRDVIRLLVQKGAYIGLRNSRGEMPIKFMKAATLEYLFDTAITTKKHSLRKDHQLILDYSLLVCKYLDQLTVTETKPLVAISEVRQLRPLLTHPFVTAFLDLKWYIIMHKLTIINYLFYTLYVIFLSSYLYVLIAYVPETTQYATSNCQNNTPTEFPQMYGRDQKLEEITILQIHWYMIKLKVQNNATSSPQNNTPTAPQNSTTPDVPIDYYQFQLKEDIILWYMVAILNSILFLREFLQFVIDFNSKKFGYVKNPENWMEIALILITFVILCCPVDDIENRSLLLVTAIFLSWIELMLLILSHPITSVHITMFKAVAWNSFKFLLCFLILIVAFALSFYLLFKDTHPEFKDILLAIFKTGTMSAGEYQVFSSPIDCEFGIRHFLFLLFIFLVPIVLFNLLNGVAISDIQGIRNNAEVVSTVARVKLIAHMEEIVSELLSFLDKLAYHYWTLIKRHSSLEAREFCDKLKERYYWYINLFSALPEDGKVHIMPNQRNAIFIVESQKFAGQSNRLNGNNRMPRLFISAATIENIKEKLSRQTGDREKANDCEEIFEINQAVTHLRGVFESHSIWTEDRLLLMEQKLAEISTLLKEKL